jgi:hypothetical protein
MKRIGHMEKFLSQRKASEHYAVGEDRKGGSVWATA